MLEHAKFLSRKQNYGNGKIRIPLSIFCLARSSPMLYSANLVDDFFRPPAQICCAHPQPSSRALREKQLTGKNDEFQLGEPLAMNYTGWQLQDCHQIFLGCLHTIYLQMYHLEHHAHPLDFLTQKKTKKNCGNPDAGMIHC